jgi:hypothetical protein
MKKRYLDLVKARKRGFNETLKANKMYCNEKREKPISKIQHGKHSVFCPTTGRNKLLFHSIEEVKRYLAYAKTNFNNKNIPIRYYRCDCYCGYHTTHKPKTFSLKKVVIGKLQYA